MTVARPLCLKISFKALFLHKLLMESMFPPSNSCDHAIDSAAVGMPDLRSPVNGSVTASQQQTWVSTGNSVFPSLPFALVAKPGQGTLISEKRCVFLQNLLNIGRRDHGRCIPLRHCCRSTTR